MLNRWHLKIGSWLGLLAILMATLAPTISQTLAARDGGDATMAGEHCQMASMDEMASMPGMPMGDASSDTLSDVSADAVQTTQAVAGTPDDPAGKHTQMAAGDACGYCSLLAHLPVMPGVETLFVAAVRARQHTVATRFHRVCRVEPLTFAQPRAPPVIS
jgi:hypothetical protein